MIVFDREEIQSKLRHDRQNKERTMKRIACFIGGCGLTYGAVKFLALTYMLLAAGQFFTPILAVCFAVPCLILGIILITGAFN